MSLRSLLFTPGNHARRMEKTREADTDGVILDLEDAVAVAEKPAARATAVAYLAEQRGHRKAYIRINDLSTEWAFGDLAAVCVAGLDGIILPKVQSARDLEIADYIISSHERERGLPPGSIDVIPIIETALAVENMNEIARAAPRVRRLAFGSGDFTNDTGTSWTLDNPLTALGRAQLAIVSRAAGIEAPIDTVWPNLDDESGLSAEAASARAMGYQGKMTIHPRQLDIINRTFSPNPDEVAFARKLLEAFEAAEKAGSSAIVVDGKFIDYPVVFRARSVVESAERMGAGSPSSK